MRRVLAVFGTRPEAIKMAPVIRAAAAHGVACKVCVSAQHRELLDDVLQLFGIAPDYDLDIMRRSQSLTDIAVGVLRGLEDTLRQERPELVLVHGDTSTTLYASLAAYYAQIPVGHVEAGLRSYDKYSPWPEEGNRVLADRLADLCFAPTAQAERALQREAVQGAIVVTGNTVIDAVLQTVAKDHRFEQDALRNIAQDDTLVVVETHRRENLGARHRAVFRAIRRLADSRAVHVLFPVHPNPAVREPAEEILRGHPRIELIEPLGYADFVNLMARASFVLTDSGGLQEECPALGVPVLLLRDTSERPEAIETGAVQMVGCDEEAVLVAAQRLCDDDALRSQMAKPRRIYGDGGASDRIWRAVLHWFGDTQEPATPFNAC